MRAFGCNCLAQKGHKVKVLEASQTLSGFEAGIQFSSNATTIWTSWGVLPALEEVAYHAESMRVNRYHKGEALLQETRGPAMRKIYGSPWVI